MNYLEIANQVKKEVEKEIGMPIRIRKYRTSPWAGSADYNPSEIGPITAQLQGFDAKVGFVHNIEVPEPKSNISLSTFLHELGHLTKLSSSQKKSCLREFYAEMFSLDQLKRFGIKRNRKMIKNSNWYMAYSLCQALNRKMKDIPEELKKYKKFARRSHIYRVVNGIPSKVNTERWYAI